jgi:ribosomal protein S18 acetylase RimI-like enzyme
MALQIRDATIEDIPACLAVDTEYETERVWQMHVQPETMGRGVLFRVERLPRPMDVTYPQSERRLKLALEANQCFLTAYATSDDDDPVLLGYLTMRADPVHQAGWIQDIVVGRQFRRQGIGTRLVKVATRWAREHELDHIVLETQTINHPAIEFCTKQGMAFCGYHDQYFRNGDIAVFFGKSI